MPASLAAAMWRLLLLGMLGFEGHPPAALANTVPWRRPINCPEGPGQPWPAILAQVERGVSALQRGQAREARAHLSDAIEAATVDLRVAHECSLGIAAAYRVLALAHAQVAEPALQISSAVSLRSLQVGLRFMHLCSNWLTHTFVEHDYDVERIDGSAWPITLQESADEHRAAVAFLAEGGRPAGHRAILEVPHDYRDPSLTIAIVSLCAYPQGHVLPAYAMSNHQIYAERHGYTYHVSTVRDDSGRPAAWGKVSLMRELIARRRWDWVMWADCDVYFMNLSITLDSLLFRYGGRAPRPWEPLGLHPDFHFLVTEDHAMLNTGIFLARSSEWVEAMLQRVWGPEDSVWTNHPWWEQAAMSWDFWSDLALRFRDADHDEWAQKAGREAEPMDGIYPEPVRIAPQVEFNSYHPITSRFLADTWSAGKFVLAFNGVNAGSSPNVARELYSRYYEVFCDLNRVQHRCIKVANFMPWLHREGV